MLSRASQDGRTKSALPSQLLFVAELRKHGSIILAREAMVNSIFGGAAPGLSWNIDGHFA
jgi:hypothetical protein